MAEISAALVKELRDETNVGMMECKKALIDAGGDKAKAVQLLRERGIAVASKKASREAKNGVIAAGVAEGGRVGTMIEVNCETDFVARNEIFQAFVAELVRKAARIDGDLASAVKEETNTTIQKTGENVLVRRNLKFTVQGEGLVATYIHLGSKLGVMVEVGTTRPGTAAQPAAIEAARDICMHIAANRPPFLNRAAVSPDVLASERAIYAKQVENKPANIIEKIVNGKIEKYYSTVCLVEQPFVKNPDVTVTQMLEATGKPLGDTLTVRRFAVYQLGE